jgi:hypothetical protein
LLSILSVFHERIGICTDHAAALIGQSMVLAVPAKCTTARAAEAALAATARHNYWQMGQDQLGLSYAHPTSSADDRRTNSHSKCKSTTQSAKTAPGVRRRGAIEHAWLVRYW